MSSIAWKEIDWTLVNSRVFRYQIRIFKASQNNNRAKVKCLQKRLLKSFDTKLLAVKTVTTLNKSRPKNVISNQLWITDLQKIKIVKKLKLDGKTLPIQRIYVDKLTTQFSHISILEDRAKHILCKFALEPEWEARFETNSYGFRPGRTSQDAVKAIFLGLQNGSTNKNYHKYVLQTDLSRYFSQINHCYLLKKLDTLPKIKQQVKAWLTKGNLKKFSDVKKNHNFQLIHSNISHEESMYLFLFNIAFHGLENYLKEWICQKFSFAETNKPSQTIRVKSFSIIRYMNHLLVIHDDESILYKMKLEIKKWFWNELCLKISKEKIFIYHTSNSFNFLGFTFFTSSKNTISKIKIYPSRTSQLSLLVKVRDIVQKNRSASSYKLIKLLHSILIKWVNYYKYSECSVVFKKLTNLIFFKLRAWVFRRDTRNGRNKIKQRYFPSGQRYTFNGIKHYDNWILNGKQIDKNNISKNNWLFNISWVKSENWIKVKSTKSPFDGDKFYWRKRILIKSK